MFIVDMNGYLPTGGRPTPVVTRAQKIFESDWTDARTIFIARPRLIAELAPAVKSWSETRRLRSVREELLKLRWLFYFLDDIAAINTEIPTDPELNQLANASSDFVYWLRQQSNIGAKRMGNIYSTVSQFLGRALRRTVWPPSPFSDDDKSLVDGECEYTKAQFIALLRMSKSIVCAFMRERAEMRAVFREISRRDPHVRCRKKQSPEDRHKYRVRNAVTHVREALLAGRAPSKPRSWTPRCIFPNRDLVGAAFLLVMIRTGANEQPILDLEPGRGLAPGPWLNSNPFGDQYRTIIAWKNRTGQRGPNRRNRIPLSARAKPQLHAVKLLRYQELLGNWCRKAIAASPGELDSSFARAARKAARSFWIYWDSGKWRCLTGSLTHSLINSLIEKNAVNWPDLIGDDGKPIKYSARALRNAYLEFVALRSGFSIATAQQELAHSRDSGSTQRYLQKRWAKTYAHEGLRQFNSATKAILDGDRDPLSAEAIRRRLQKQSGDFSGREELVQVQKGIWCVDPSSPPSNVYRIRSATDTCPAEQCHDCDLARCFTSSLPELAREVLNLRARRDKVAAYLWNGSAADVRFRMIEDLLHRYPEDRVREAFRKAEWLDTPALEYRPSR